MGSIFDSVDTGDKQSVSPSLSAILTYLLVIHPATIGVLVCCFLTYPVHPVADCIMRGALFRIDIVTIE